MKRLRRFSYFEPTSVAEAAGLLAAGAGAALPLAGGTDLLIDMKTAKLRPSTLVNLKRIAGLDTIEAEGRGTRVGALTRIRDLECSPMVQAKHRALSQAAGVLASRPIRMMATIGGNIGRASPASDMAPALIVHRARVVIEGTEGGREVAIEGFYLGPGVTRLADDEIVTSVFLPDPVSGTGTAYLKLGKRGGGSDIALVGVAASVVLGDRGEVADVRIALASVAPTPLQAIAAEQTLRGLIPADAVLAEAADAAAEETTPISDIRASASYRRRLARVLTLRALQEAVRVAGGPVSP